MTSSQLRAIAAVRLSHLTDATTSVGTQAESIEDYCKRKNIKIVASTSDLDVSGGKPIQERPGVGEWLTEEHINEWDVLIGYKLDRLFRNHRDFVNFYHDFCELRGKQIISVSEDIDMSADMGEFIAGILVKFAEWEIKRMSARRSVAAEAIRKSARWNGGIFPFGYEPYKQGSEWYLKPHHLYGNETKQMALNIIAGKTAQWVAEDLNRRHIPTSRDVQLKFSGKPAKNYRWRTHAVVHHLRSDAIRGYVLQYKDGNHKPSRVLDDNGDYVMREALISDDIWYELQKKLDERSLNTVGVRSPGSALVQVGYCGYCGAPLHSNSARKHGTTDGRNYYYQCRDFKTCDPSRSVRQNALDEFVSEKLLMAVGGCELTERKIIPGDDHSQALASIGMRIADLTTQHYVHGGVQDFTAKMSALQAEHDRISELPKEADEVQNVSTGQTFAARWEQMDAAERNAYLRKADVKVYVGSNEQHEGGQTVPVVLPSGHQLKFGLVMSGWLNAGQRVTIHLGQLADLRGLAATA